MLTHIVFFTFKNTPQGSALEHAQRVKEMLETLPAAIPEIHSLEVGLNLFDGPSASQLALLTTFKTQADLESYRVHPKHEEVVAVIKQCCQERRFVDYLN